MEENEGDSETKTTITQGPSGHSQILHIRQDSATELDQLFNAVMNPNFKSKSLPMKLRNLPKSFFQQPDRPRHPGMHSHSRSMGGLVSTPINHSSHSRSSSTDSGASHTSGLNLSSSNVQGTVQAGSGLVQRVGNFSPGGALHHGFNNQAHVGVQSQHIAHGRSKSSPASLQILNANLQLKVAHQGDASNIEVSPDMPLPQGWEMAKTMDGQVYYMNHTNRTTTWVDPRIAIVKERQQQQERMSGTQNRHTPPGMHGTKTEQPLPPGWEQATTPQGEIYFINHETRTTSWLDPRFQAITLAGQGQMTVPMQNQLNKRNTSEPQMMLKRLTKEKEMMMRQREMLKQVTNPMDPFLSSSTSYQERETGHNSAVSGMTGNYVVSQSGDDYLEEMETDTSNPTHQGLNRQQSHIADVQQSPQHHTTPTGRLVTQQRQFPDFLDSLPASSVDYHGSIANQATGMLDGEDLVPSISETLSPDLMNDVESMLNPVVKSENMDNMTWL